VLVFIHVIAQLPPSAKRSRVEPSEVTEKKPNVDAVTLEEQLSLLQHYEHQIVDICNACRFDRAIRATAIIFFKRFYLHGAPTEYFPDSMADACIFLAIKTEACPYTEVGVFCSMLVKHRRIADADLVSLELPLLMGLKYHLTVYHPYRPMKALLVEMVTAYADKAEGVPGSYSSVPTRGSLLKSNEPEFQTSWDALQQRAFAFADMSLFTDAPLLYAPAQIGAACLVLASENVVLDTVASSPPAVQWFVLPFLNAKLAAGPSSASLTEISSSGVPTVHPGPVVERIAALLRPLVNVKPSKEQAEDSSSRLRRNMNPAFQRGTVEYDARRAFGDSVKAEYKAGKPEAKAQAIAIQSSTG
jgi:hypothetical protein